MIQLRCLNLTFVTMLAVLLTIAMPRPAAGSDRLLLIKASFVLNFLKFTEWPTNVMGKEDNDLTLAVVGDEPLFIAMEETLSGKIVQGRVVRVRVYASAKTWLLEQKPSHAVFLASSVLQKLPDLGPVTSNPAVLTIADHPGFCAAGGMLNLFDEGGRMRFEANPDAVRSAGLTLSAQMLNLANIVKTASKEKL
jgi:hypothetical protein